MDDQTPMIELTSEIVANYVANNTVSIDELPALIRTISQTLNSLGQAAPALEPEVEKPSASQIKKSIRPDGLVSFVDGKPYKTLKRHLAKHGLTIAEYKDKYGLPKDYPSTSPEYSAKRSAMAKTLGLGRQRAGAVEVQDVEPPAAKRAPRKAKA
jgi:predicted transcriptional regulator